MSILPNMMTARLPDGLSLPYLDQGQSPLPPLIFLHGITDSHRSFETVLAHLPSTLRALAPSQRGHGNASAPARYRLTDFASDLEHLMTALSLDKAVLVGHSMGAAVAQRFAIDYPERVAGLVLVGAFAALGRNPACATFGTAAMATLADPIDREFVRAFQESTLAHPVPEAMLDTIIAESLKVPARVWKAAWSSLIESDLTHDLHRITAPTLLVWGDRDSVATAAEQTTLLRAIQHVQFQAFTGAGHAPHWEEPARFAALVAGFAEAIGRAQDATRPDRVQSSLQPSEGAACSWMA